MVLFECELELDESDQPIQVVLVLGWFGREAVPGDGVTAFASANPKINSDDVTEGYRGADLQ
jgi:hypothetical protein